MKWTRLIIVRHAEVKKDSITPLGFKQIEALNKFLNNLKIDVLYASSMKRSLLTAKLLAKPKGLNVKISKNLRELNKGDWANSKDFVKKWIKFYEKMKKRGMKREDIRPPHGENSFDHQRRVKKFLRLIFKNYKGKNILIVGHSGTNKVIIGTLLGKDPDEFYDIEQENCCVNELIVTESGKVIVKKINWVDHLKDIT
jgi:probable phosphoglycerate mutase